MGEGRTYVCKKCGYRNCITTGVGFSYAPGRFSNLENWDDKRFNMWHCVLTSKKLIDKIHDLLKNKQGVFCTASESDYRYGYDLYDCKKCNCTLSRFYYRIEYIDNGKRKFFEPTYRCPKKHTLTHRENIENKSVLEDENPPLPYCPQCGEDAEYSSENFIYWD